jgi:hypothetical protein
MKATSLVVVAMAFVSGLSAALTSFSALARDSNRANAASASSDKIAGVEVRGTSFIVHLSSGRDANPSPCWASRSATNPH